ncbi:hypothetical protein [Synechococcus elongatus]|uniref:CDP-glycerol--glycerophosphate glycerophosphotransferase n=1 Tax=Synechococcus elongatus PCC 11802 TaxID=2283154 RepID=A0AAT9JXD8_SYNEL|nr:hypothetical protein [Synechococcus elongatus]
MRPRPQIAALIYSRACLRVLVPYLERLRQIQAVTAGDRPFDIWLLLPTEREVKARELRSLVGPGCRLSRSLWPLRYLHANPQQSVGLFCLDHQLFPEAHRLGIRVAGWLRQQGVATTCSQHGGTDAESLASLASSASETLLIWGRYAEQVLRDRYHWSSSQLKVVGNPLHDRLLTSPQSAELNFDQPLILVATTLQREYDDRPDPKQCYRDYLRCLFTALEGVAGQVVIKRHPRDPQHPDFYAEILAEFRDLQNRTTLLWPQDQPDTYQLLQQADLVISRASTVLEEAVMLGKAAIAFDLFPNGPASRYRHLQAFPNFQWIAGAAVPPLTEAIRTALITPKRLTDEDRDRCIAAFSDRLDGRSVERGVAVIRNQLQTQPKI